MQDLARQEYPVRSLKCKYHYHLQKKGTKSDCGNYRGIALLSIPLVRVLLNRLLPLSEGILPESQCGFRISRGTTDMILVARKIQEKCREQNKDLYMTFTELTNVYSAIYFVSDGKIAASMPVSSWRPAQLVLKQWLCRIISAFFNN